MRFHARKRFSFGPIRWNWTQRGPASWALHVWRFTYNFTTRRWTFDTPGPGYVTGKRHGGRG